jgi:ABC-type glycerol-3-phosphate transport system substrate-binding protein
LGYREAFINQKVAMTLDGMWMISQFSAKSDLEYGIGMIPRGQGAYVTWSGADTCLAAATGKNRDTAFDVIKTAYNSPTAQLIFADYGGPQAIGIPVYKSALNDPKWKPQERLQVPSKQAPFGKPDPVFLNSGSWEWDLVQNKLQEILLTNEDPQKVLDDAAAKTVSDYLSKIG